MRKRNKERHLCRIAAFHLNWLTWISFNSNSRISFRLSIIFLHLSSPSAKLSAPGLLRGGVRLRSSLSPEEAQKQKWCFGAKTGIFFINSCIIGAYYMKSYKKLDLKAQNLEITSFAIRKRPKIVII